MSLSQRTEADRKAYKASWLAAKRQDPDWLAKYRANHAKANADWYQGHRVQQAAHFKKYYETNKEVLESKYKIWYSHNKREVSTRNKQYYEQTWAWRYVHTMASVLDSFKAGPCSDCGEFFPSECMDFDHREPSFKKCTLGRFRSSIRTARAYSLMFDEMSKCDLVCSNCHRIRTKDRHYMQHRKEEH